MRQKHVLAALAIIAVTGAVSVPNSLAVVWRVDSIQSLADPKPWIGHRLMDQGRREWNPLIHTVQDTGDPRINNPEYQTLGHPRQGPSPFSSADGPSRPTPESGSSSNESRYGPSSSDKYFFEKEKSPASGTFSDTIYGQPPTTPSADPLVRELSR